MDFGNSTELDSERLGGLLVRHTRPYSHEGLRVRVRHSRGADFSGTCYYADNHIYVNLGRHNRYPYYLGTNIARSRSNRTHWWRDTYRLALADGYQLALFVFLHEFFHYLVHQAGRNPRRKESMCDRFATRILVDDHGAAVVDPEGRAVPRENWDFQDVHRFVTAAPRDPQPTLWDPGLPRAIPVVIYGA